MSRTAKVERRTRETDIAVGLELDGTGTSDINTPLPFLSHMVEQISRHGLLNLQVRAQGDTEVDGHHTTEDLGIVFGMAMKEALGDGRGAVLAAAGTSDEPPTAAVWDVA